MQLLTKQQIDSAKAQERKAEIDEGVKLARKVDELRELLQREEKAFATYRVETLKVIAEELAPKQRELNEVKAELAKALDALAIARIPVDAELEKAKNLHLEAQERHDTASGMFMQAEQELKALRADKLEAKKALESAHGMEGATRHTLTDATSKLQEAKTILSQAEAEKAETERVRIKVTEELNTRENSVVEKEKGLILYEERLTLRETELGKEKRKLDDMRATLERSLARLKNK